MAQVFLKQEPVLTTPAASGTVAQFNRCDIETQRPHDPEVTILDSKPGLLTTEATACVASSFSPVLQCTAGRAGPPRSKSRLHPSSYDLGPPTLTAGTRCPRLSNGNSNGSFRMGPCERRVRGPPSRTRCHPCVVLRCHKVPAPVCRNSVLSHANHTLIKKLKNKYTHI